MELLFILAFTLHNIEEGLWLPNWTSKYIKNYNITKQGFHFAVLCVTCIGYFITFLALQFGQEYDIFRYLFVGFVITMGINAIFPHLLTSIRFHKYVPGTLTGIFLNLPISVSILKKSLEMNMQFNKIMIITISIIIIFLIILRPLFKLGNKLIDFL